MAPRTNRPESIRQRVKKFLFREEVASLDRLQDTILDAYRRGPALFSPEEFSSTVKEFDSHTFSNLVRELGYLQLNYSSEPTESDRLRAVTESRFLYRTSVMVQYALFLWGAYGFGENVQVIPKDKKAEPIWDEFWTADRNAAVLSDRNLADLSDILLRDGEFYFVFYVSQADGTCTLRILETPEITEWVSDPNDAHTTVFYRRQWEDPELGPQDVYYPDAMSFISSSAKGKNDSELNLTGVKPEWSGRNREGKRVSSRDLLPEDAVRADKSNPGTFVCVLPVVFNRKGGHRGWPLMVAGFPWVKEHEQFRVNRANVAEAAAMFFRDVKSTGGSRAVKDIKKFFESTYASGSSVETNPPPVAGSSFLHNEGVEMKNVSQLTGAGDAKEDGQALAWYAALSAGLFPHYMGVGDAYRLATATSMEQPILRQFNRYQRFWGSVWQDVVRITLTMQERWSQVDFSDFTADINLDKLIQTDSTELFASLSSAYSSMLNPLIASGSIPTPIANRIIVQTWQLALSQLGVQDPEKLVDQEEFDKLLASEKAEAEKKAEEIAQGMGLSGSSEKSGVPGEGSEKPGSEVPENSEKPKELEEWDELQHPREPKGSSDGGQFASVEGRARALGVTVTKDLVSNLDQLARAGGFSYQVVNKSMPIRGYMVSPYKEREHRVPINSFKERDVLNYVLNNFSLLREDNSFLGGWFNNEDGNVYLDVSIRLDSLEAALKLAKEHDQEGIWGLEQKEFISAREQEGNWSSGGQILGGVSRFRSGNLHGSNGGRFGVGDNGRGVEGGNGEVLEGERLVSLEAQAILAAARRLAEG